MKPEMLLRMMQVSDSLFPIGAFSLSNGWETLVQQGKLSSQEQLQEYTESYLQILPYGDMGTMMLACANAKNQRYLTELDALSIALKGPREVRDGSRKLCSRFLKLWRQIHSYELLEWYEAAIKTGICLGNHAIAIGLYASDIGLQPEEAGLFYGYSLLSAIITNVVKTVPLSQIAGQRVLHEKIPALLECVQKAKETKLEDLGISGVEFDLAAMNHETLYSRLYMS